MAVVGPVLRAFLHLAEFGTRPELLSRWYPICIRMEDGAAWVDITVELGESPHRAVDTLSEVAFRRGVVAGADERGFVPLQNLYRLSGLDPEDLYIEAAAPVHPELDVSVPRAWGGAQRGSSGGSGQGVIVGIVDTGIDLRHGCFRDANGMTRVRTLWDQRLSPTQPGEESPPRYAYGVQWRNTAIDTDLSGGVGYSGSPLLRHIAGAHGTAVAGVAAGNGNAPPADRYVGVAPEADLMIVAVHATGLVLSSTNNLIDAVRYVFDEADRCGQRAVVNVSLGAWRGPHDDTGDLEKALQQVLDADRNRIVVTSAGNTADKRVHAHLRVSQGQCSPVALDVPSYGGRVVLVQLWYPSGNRLEVRVSDPQGVWTRWVGTNDSDLASVSKDDVDIEHVEHCRENGDNVAVIALKAGGGTDLLTGTWTIELKGAYVPAAAEVHAWVDRTRVPQQAGFASSVQSEEFTATAPSACPSVLCVGGYDAALNSGPLGPYSGRGPSRAGTDLNLLAAPGSGITMPTSAAGTAYATDTGTSFAAPHVTGAIALLLQAVPGASRDDVVDCLRTTAADDAMTRAGPSTAWGWGRLDIGAALVCLRGDG